MDAKVKVGIVGLGGMGQGHLKTLSNDVPRAAVTAVCDIVPGRFKEAAGKGLLAPGIRRFDNYQALIDSGVCEAVAVVTPHPCHAEISRYAFARGLHVMCDKPITVAVSEADAMIAAWRQTKVKFCTMYSKRTTAANQVLKEWIDQGRVGTIQRVDMVWTNWLRTQAYYNSQTWRGTWAGEGGGFLMNQAPHDLDLLYWWFGPARSISAEIGTRFHEIETEDEVDARIKFAAGFPCRFYANTGEVSGLNRVEVVGTKGTLIFDGVNLAFRELPQPTDVLIRESKATGVDVAFKEQKVEVPALERGHKIVFRDWCDAILEDRPNDSMLAPGDQGMHAVEWANAMIMSSIEKREVNLPIDRARYDELLADLRAGKIKINGG